VGGSARAAIVLGERFTENPMKALLEMKKMCTNISLAKSRSFIEREDHGANFFIHGKEMKYFLETPKEEYKPYMDPPRDMVLSTLWVADEVHDNMEKYGGKYAAFKAACEGDLERARDHWEFIKAKVTESISLNKYISKIST